MRILRAQFPSCDRLTLNRPVFAAILCYLNIVTSGRISCHVALDCECRELGAVMLKRLMLILGLLLALIPAQGPSAPPPQPSALSLVQPGQWTFKSREDPAENRSMCVRDPRTLLQIRHGAALCSRFVISNEPRQTTVHYTCPGNGHGRTTLQVDSASVIRIESQGIIEKQPFALMLEGRRVGECSAVTERLIR